MSDITPSPEPRPVLAVGEARDRLSAALAELDDALSVPDSIRRHPVRWAVGGAAVAVAIVGGLVWAFRTKH